VAPEPDPFPRLRLPRGVEASAQDPLPPSVTLFGDRQGARHAQLIVRGERRLPRRLAGAAIQRLEIPHGRFERRLALPDGAWELVAQEFSNGCLQLLLARR